MIPQPPYSLVECEIVYRIMATHEAGHLVMYRRFGVRADVAFDFDSLGNPLGAVASPECQLDGFSRACVGWAGLMAEHLEGRVVLDVPGAPPLTEKTVIAWALAVRPSLNEADALTCCFNRDEEGALRLTLRTLLSPLGSDWLWRETQRLIKIVRHEHAMSLAAAGRAVPPEMRRVAQELFALDT